MNALAEELAKQLAKAVGARMVDAIGRPVLAEIALKIADTKERHEAEEDPEEKAALEDDIAFLQSQLLLIVEKKKLKLAKNVESALKSGIMTVLKSQFPFLAAIA